MQIDEASSLLDLVLRGGNAGLLVFVSVLGWKVNSRLNRDESLRADYPPHRHINGQLLYPKEYQPSEVEQLNGRQ